MRGRKARLLKADGRPVPERMWKIAFVGWRLPGSSLVVAWHLPGKCLVRGRLIAPSSRWANSLRFRLHASQSGNSLVFSITIGTPLSLLTSTKLFLNSHPLFFLIIHRILHARSRCADIGERSALNDWPHRPSSHPVISLTLLRPSAIFNWQ
jgi:hypothetical protein